MEEALRRVAPHADSAHHTIWFAFCVLNDPELVRFEVDFNGGWRGQVSRALALARKHVVTPPYWGTRPARRVAATSSDLSGSESYGVQRKLLIYAPSINPSSFLHLSIKGESYALREFPPSGPPRRWVLDDSPTTSQLTAKHHFVHEIDVTSERMNLQGEPEFWRQRIAAVNRRFRLGSA
jgi:hypothetical protein